MGTPLVETVGGERLGLAKAWEEAQRKGWSAGDKTTLNYLLFEARQMGWEEMETRRGKGTATVLRPSTQSDAPYPRSISAVYGLNEQPLHVDGAHFHNPPDAVLLFCKSPNETPTRILGIGEILRRNHKGKADSPHQYLRHGIFIVGSGPAAFLAPVLEEGQLRYDPNVMTPADLRARQSAEHISSLQDDAFAFTWSTPMSFLLIANRRALHGRAKVAESDADREVTRVAFRIGAKA